MPISSGNSKGRNKKRNELLKKDLKYLLSKNKPNKFIQGLKKK